MRENKLKVLFDSNVVIDILSSRDGSEDSIKCFLKMASDDFQGFLLTKQITDIYYSMRKYTELEERNNIICQLLMVFEVLNTSTEDIEKALLIEGTDIEDNILISSLETYSLDYIVTNNIKHFDNYKDKCLTPSELLKINDSL